MENLSVDNGDDDVGGDYGYNDDGDNETYF